MSICACRFYFCPQKPLVICTSTFKCKRFTETWKLLVISWTSSSHAQFESPVFAAWTRRSSSKCTFPFHSNSSPVVKNDPRSSFPPMTSRFIIFFATGLLRWNDDTGGLTQSGPLVNSQLKLKAKQPLLVKVRLQWKPFASLLRFRPLENKLKAVLSQTPNIQFKSWTIITLDCKLTGKNISVQRAPLAWPLNICSIKRPKEV